MKKRYILIILLCILCLTGCERSNLNSAYKITDKIVKALQEENPSLDTLNSKEKRIYNKIIESNKEENYVINLSKIKTFDMDEVDEPIDASNDSKVYTENGDYKIKYSDITWHDMDDTQYFMVNIGGKRVEVRKYLVPILYKDTKGLSYYSYKYMNYKKDKDYTYFYYESVGKFGGLTFVVNNKNIEDMTLRYSDTYEGTSVKEVNYGAKLFEAIIIIIVVVIIMIFIIFTIYKSISNKEGGY